MAGIPSDDDTNDSTIDPLAEDNQTPFSPADPLPDDTDVPSSEQLNSTHPATDTGVQPEEVYEEGLPGAAQAAEPNSQNNVTGYNPEKDQRRDEAA